MGVTHLPRGMGPCPRTVLSPQSQQPSPALGVSLSFIKPFLKTCSSQTHTAPWETEKITDWVLIPHEQYLGTENY